MNTNSKFHFDISLFFFNLNKEIKLSYLFRITVYLNISVLAGAEMKDLSSLYLQKRLLI